MALLGDGREPDHAHADGAHDDLRNKPALYSLGIDSGRSAEGHAGNLCNHSLVDDRHHVGPSPSFHALCLDDGHALVHVGANVGGETNIDPLVRMPSRSSQCNWENPDGFCSRDCAERADTLNEWLDKPDRCKTLLGIHRCQTCARHTQRVWYALG